jgi:nucleoredoxin
MRRFLFVLLAGCLAAAGSIGEPLSNKEIALMLRSGFSSDSVLREMAARRVLEPFDAATKKSMVEFGANAQLINALESGQYAVSTAEAVQAEHRRAEITARRAAQVDADRKLAAVYQEKAKARDGATKVLPPGMPLLTGLNDKLVRCRDGTISRADPQSLAEKRLVGLYYSAHWCAPCRKFTPELVEYYNRIAPEHPELEIVFVSLDRSRFNWETYMRDTKMPWLAIDFDQIKELEGVRNVGGDSIPSLLVLDQNSHIVASSYEGDKYVGPQNALAVLDKMLAQNTAGKASPDR